MARHLFRRSRLAITAASLTVAVSGALLPALPAPAATPVSTVAATVLSGRVDWGVKASFRSYVTGPIASGAIATSTPATTNADGTFRFPTTSGSVDTSAGSATASTGGSVRFTGHVTAGIPLLDLTIADVRVNLSGTSGSLVADVASKDMDTGEARTYDDVALATLALAGITPASAGDTLTWTGIPAALTAAGEGAFSGQYAAGAALDPVTISVRVQSGETPKGANRSFVTSAFADFIDREATTDEVNSWSGKLDRGETTRRSFLGTLATSDDWLGAVVGDLYQDTLGRPADAAGKTHWVSQLRSKRMTVAQVAARFYSSSEYFNGKGGATPEKWVTDLYAKVLGRVVDPAGLAYWVGTLEARGRFAVSEPIYQSPESARARVRGLYDSLLHRAPEAGGLDFWASRVRTSGDITLAIELAYSAEYFTQAATRFP